MFGLGLLTLAYATHIYAAGTAIVVSTLADDNGGATQTMALLNGSSAIGAGDVTICQGDPINNLDQRGYARTSAGDALCDIGAFEKNSIGLATSPPTSTPTDTATPTNTSSPTVTWTSTATPTKTNTPTTAPSTNTATLTQTPTLTSSPTTAQSTNTPTLTRTPTLTGSPVPAADLEMMKAVVPSGAKHKYSLVVNNLGTLAAQQLVITDKLPKNYVISKVKGGKASCTVVARKVTCKLTTLSAGGKINITIIAAPHGASGQNCAKVKTSTHESSTTNNKACVVVPGGTNSYQVPEDLSLIQRI